ncbi:MAG: family 43 glycosylhydrolase, partial [Stackebrandtia sp.]
MNLGTIFKRRRRTVIVAGTATAVLLGLTSAAMGTSGDTSGEDVGAQAALQPTKITDFNHADPSTIEWNGKFYSYATDGTKDVRKIPTIRADTLLGTYTRRGKSLDHIPWANGGPVMGPHVVHKGGTRFHMYFAARQKGGSETPRCIGVAVSLNGPEGPFVPRKEPLACDNAHNGAIAPSFFHDPRTGRNYLLYKTNGPNAIRRAWIQP